MTTPNPKTCPLCGEPNSCGMAAGEQACWCFAVTMDPDALARIPEAAKGKACVCQRCGVKAALPEAPKPEKQ
ncbi:MAG: cysteine-rich CWC family protein [Myxococcales bacterium]|nr:cysteine-rich CWC family protein [Myxococcales bacterium]